MKHLLLTLGFSFLALTSSFDAFASDKKVLEIKLDKPIHTNQILVYQSEITQQRYAIVFGFGTFIINVTGISPFTYRGFNASGDSLEIKIASDEEEKRIVQGSIVYHPKTPEQVTLPFTGVVISQ